MKLLMNRQTILGCVFLLTSCSSTKVPSFDSVYGLNGLIIKHYDKKIVSLPDENRKFEDILPMDEGQMKDWVDSMKLQLRKETGAEERYLARDLFFKASELEKIGELAKATSILSMIFNQYEETEEASVHYAILLLKTGQYEESYNVLGKFSKSVKDEQKKIGINSLMLSISEAKDKPANVVLSYKNVIKKLNSPIEICKDYIAYTQKNFGQLEAIDALDYCVLYSKNKVAQFSLAVEKAKLSWLYKEKSNAHAQMIQLFAKNNADDDLMELLSETILSNPETDNQYKEALTFYRLYMQAGGSSSKLLSKYIDLLVSAGLIESVIAPLKKLVDLNPKSISLKARLVLVYAESKRWKEALDTLEGIKDSDELTDGKNSLAYYYYSVFYGMGKISEAMTYLKQVGASDNAFISALVQVGEYYKSEIQQKSVEKNKLLLEWSDYLKSFQSVKMNEDQQVAYEVEYANYYYVRSDKNKALEILESLNSKELLGLKEEYFLASVYAELNFIDKSILQIKKVLTQDSEFAHGWNFLGYLLLEHEGLESRAEAYAYLQKALTLMPNDGHILDSVGYYFLLEGKLSKAQDYFAKAMKLKPTEIIIALHFVDALIAMGNSEEAKKFVDQVQTQYTTEEFLSLRERITGYGVWKRSTASE